MKVHIVCKSGVEWNEIVGVYAKREHAETARARHEVRRKSSKSVTDMLSQYVIETHTVTEAKP